MSKSLLILGNPTSIYIKQYIINVLYEKELDVYLGGNYDLSEEDKVFFSKFDVRYINLFKIEGIYKYLSKAGILLGYVQNLKNIKNGKFDYVHIHYIGNHRLMGYVYKIYKKIANKLILTFWGSDILDINQKKAGYIKGLLKQSDTIVIPTIQMQTAFKKYFGDEFNCKIKPCLFGNPVVQTYMDIKSDVDIIEQFIPIKLPDNKKVIAVGYNGSPRQNHFKILEILNSLPYEMKDNIFVLVQAGYGGTTDYKNDLKKYIDKMSIDGAVLEKFIDVKETIALKNRVDIFIHGQMTDALSSSVLEYILMGSFVLNPRWIQYDEWKALGIKYIEYDNFLDIRNIIINILENKVTKYHNEEIIEKNFSWEARKAEWQSLYE
ncbi:MAG: glycosyltransferase [Clostridiales bacterium]|nr:glycosyltransferase [Clostridiales bacterium]MDY6117235.1 glycosyltransferase [Anaerovoracaceae bacterium]